MNDIVNKPAHYTQGKVECLESLQSMMSEQSFRDFLRAQVIKYVWRSEDKGNSEIDLRKAGFYLNRLLQLQQTVDNPTKEYKSSH